MSNAKLVTDQHDEIRRCVGRLRGIARSEQGSLPLRRAAGEELKTLFGLLTVHFAFEEQGGYMYWITESHPHLKSEAATLLGQHAEILAGVSAILGCVPDSIEAELQAALGRVADQVTAHDAGETSLLLVAGHGH